jgi:hypothetical protein
MIGRATEALDRGMTLIQGEGVLLLASGALVAAVLLGVGWSLVRWARAARRSRGEGMEDATAPASDDARVRASATASAPASHAFAHAFSASATDLPDGELCRVAGIPRDLLPLLRARPGNGAGSSVPTGAAS